MRIPIYQVDAFSSQVFAGNPAAICPLAQWLPEATMQSIAAENNLSETAFFVRRPDGTYDLRWFTPAVEIDLCGHATLASAWVLFNEICTEVNHVQFWTKSGELVVERRGDILAMNFPARRPQPVDACDGLLKAIGGEPQLVLAARDYLLVYETEAEVRALQPDMGALLKIDKFAVIVSAPGDTCDFVSRFFAPAKGVPEDPVTGSAHSTLIPYWSSVLKKGVLHARQISARGGELFCRMMGDRVEMAGRGALFLKGEILIADA
jgi:PhzF family phenazine biosynthesis protein